MLKLIIGNRAYSSWSMRGWLAVKQSGEEFEELVVPMFDDEWDKAPRRRRVRAVARQGADPVGRRMRRLGQPGDHRVPRRPRTAASSTGRRTTRRAAWPARWPRKCIPSFANLRRELPMNVRKSFPPKTLTDEVREEIDRILQLWAQARARFGGTGEFLFGDWSRGRHHVRAGRHPLHHLRRAGPALRRDVHEGGAVAPAGRGMDRPGAGRAVGDRSI